MLNTIVAEAIDEMADELEAKVNGDDLAEGVTAVVKDAYAASKRVCFGGDNYSDEWHAEAEQRGLKNLRTTPDALPEVIAPDTVAAFEKYEVLSERELESRYEVWAEQYSTRANIEAETTCSMARTMLLPAALRHIALVEAAGMSELATEVRSLAERVRRRDQRARGGQPLPRRRRGPGPGDLRPRQPAHGDGQGPRARRQAREDRRRRPLAAAEVRGDAVHQVAPQTRTSWTGSPASAGLPSFQEQRAITGRSRPLHRRITTPRTPLPTIQGTMDRAATLLFMSAVTCYLLGRVFVEAVTGPNPVEVVVYGITAAFGLEYLMASWRSLWVAG